MPDDGTERLRGQLRETAQGGQASDYGGDRIEDTAARGVYQARRGVEALLKKKKPARGRMPDEGPRTADPPTPQEVPAERPTHHEAPPFISEDGTKLIYPATLEDGAYQIEGATEVTGKTLLFEKGLCTVTVDLAAGE